MRPVDDMLFVKQKVSRDFALAYARLNYANLKGTEGTQGFTS